jgi:uncharacterized SAM-binding protein YcdF (DUF218 family)
VGLTRRHPFVLTLATIVVLLLVVIAGSAVAVWRAAHDDEARRIDRADVILVLGAAQYDGRPSPVFLGRLEHGQLLYDKDFSDRIVVLGAGREGDALTEAEAGRRYLTEEGVPESDVDAWPHGGTTFESLRAAAEYMEERDLSSAFLVSDPWHNLRMRRMARDLGIRGFVSATWHSAARSQSTRLAGYTRETFAYLYYRVIGR